MARFGRRSTAEEVSRGIDLGGRRAIVTGANTGIGLETARVLALRGCAVTMACRNIEKASRARERLLEQADGAIDSQALEVMQLDLAWLESVRDFAQEYLRRENPLHLLINNAGVMLPDRRLTRDGFEEQFGGNHLGHFLLTNLLQERLVASAPARVVVVSSEAMQMASLGPELEDLNWEKRRFSGWRAYGSSKLMNLMFANELNRRLAGTGVVANALHPGIVETELGRDQPWYMVLVGLAMWPIMKNVARGAATSVYLATAPELGEQGGGYFADCRPARVPKLALDRDAAARLWRESERLTGLVST
jgi:NAD(P)-dependent dehydrogenase (short-subunit alcohol dehydrogenase family)